MSQFDDLLDFNDTSAGSGTVQKSNDFDPFGPSPSADVKGSSDGDLLVDFGFTGQTSVTTNGNTNGQSVNPLYELSMDQDFSATESNNLIMADDIQVSQKPAKSANPLYDLENEDSSLEPSANPLYDLSENKADINGHNVDLLETDPVVVVTDDSGVTVEIETSNDGDNLLINTGGDSQELQFEVRRDESHESMNGISDEDSELVERFTEAERGHIIQESQEILQNQNIAQESNQEQRQISFEDQKYEPEILIYEPEEENQTQEEDQIVETKEEVVESAQNEAEVLSEVQNDQKSVEVIEEIETQMEQEIVEDTQANQDIIEDTQTEQLIVEDTQSKQEIVEDTQTEQEIIEVTQTEQEVEVTQTEQEVVEVTQTEPEVVEVTQTEPDIPVYSEEPKEIAPQEDILDLSANVTEEVVTQEQEVIPTEEVRSRSSSSSSDEEKETTKTTTVTEGGRAKTVTEKSQDVKGSGGVKTVQGNVVENGLDDGVFRETNDREEISFDQMSSIRSKLESNKNEDVVTERKKSVHEEIADAEGGEYENEPVRNPDVVRECDKNIGAELPEVGSAKSILEKFKQIETTPKSYKKETTPPGARIAGKVEYVSEPAPPMDVPVQKVEGGIFENQPMVEEDVVHSYDAQEETLPEKGSARNILEKFKQIQSSTQSGTHSPQRRELTPDRNTKFEYVSEPRSVLEKYEGKVESGIFESKPSEELPDIIRSGMSSEEVLPEKGTAKSLASRYKEFSDKAATAQVSERKRELTPDKTGKVEYISEPRSTLEKFEGKSEVGVFESRPEEKEEIVKSDMAIEEVLPEKGAARNIAAKFREIESPTTPSPNSTPKPRYKEVTPPRDDLDGRTVVGVSESTPTHRGDIVKSSDVHDVVHEEELPERGMAKNIANRFKQFQETSTSPSSRGKKEFTPPSERGVFENTPQPSLQVDVQQAESGILESMPTKREDVAREDTFSGGDVEFPEEGYAKNMVSKWKQLESQSGKSTPSPKAKEFTPPRDFPMSPKSPAGVDSSVQPSDLPGQYQEQGRPGIYENHPSHRYDVAREGESDAPENMPEKDAAKSMVQKFKAIQEQAKKSEETPKPVSRKPKGSFVAVQLEKCAACQKTVYAMEKMEMNKNIYHRACFKCSHCKCVLTPKTFSMNEGVIFCTNHFKQLFARKGNYDEGFGRQQYKKKWGGETNGEEEQ